MGKKIYSTNIFNNKKYIIPDGDDKKQIDNFLLNNKGKKVVVVQGLGFVGAVMTLICSNSIKDEYAVIGVDIADKNNYWKIASINDGVFPVVASDPKIEKFFKNSKRKKNLLATYDEYAYSLADVIIVDINLDVLKKSDFNKTLVGFDVNLKPFEKGIQTIAKNCKKDVLVLVETTVPPGTCEKIVYPLLKKHLSLRNLETGKFKLGHSYERVMPGPNYIDSIQNFYRVYSGIDKKSADEIEKFLKTIISTQKYPLTRLGNTNSTEMAKVLENSYRAMNIAFMVEWSRFAEIANVDLYEVVKAIRKRPTHNNMMLPGIGVGGYCLTKDPLLASWSKQKLFDSKHPLNQSENSVQINDKMPLFAFQFLKENNISLKGKKALLLGVSYRSDIADTRYSPVEPFYDYLKSEEVQIDLHDPYVDFWDEKNINISSDLETLLNKKLDILVFCTNHSKYLNNDYLINKILNNKNKKKLILDTVGVLNKNEIKILKKNNIVKIIGRGDI